MMGTENNISLDQLRSNEIYNLKTQYNTCIRGLNESTDKSPFDYCDTDCSYYEPDQFAEKYKDHQSGTSYFHLNCQGLQSHWDEFHSLIQDLNKGKLKFDIIGISELFRISNKNKVNISGYHPLEFKNRGVNDDSKGGVGLYVKETINYEERKDLSVFIPHIIETFFIEIDHGHKNQIVGVVYRPNTLPRADLDIFMSTITDIMEKIKNERKYGLLFGDFNINLLKFSNHSKTEDFLENVFFEGFLPTITKPTRVTPTSATLIDHIYTNNIISEFQSGIILTDVADHFGTYHITYDNMINKTEPPVQYKTFRPLSEANIYNFKDELGKCDFSQVLNDLDPVNSFKKFLASFNTLFEKSFPLKVTKINSKQDDKCPWITKGFKISSRTKLKLFNKKLSKPTDNNISKYKAFNVIYNKVKRQLKQEYYKRKISETKHDMKASWKLLNNMIGRTKDKKHTFPTYFKINNEKVSEKKQIVENFNMFFSGVGENISQKVKHTTTLPDQYLKGSYQKNIFLTPVTPHEVIKTTKSLKPKNSTGYDNVSTKLLQNVIEDIAYPFCHVINQSFSSGIVPEEMKIAKVIPVYKAGEENVFNNYRPISLLTAFSKVMEKLMSNRLVKFLELNSILYSHQYGFRKGHSTIHPIIHMLNDIATGIDKSPSERCMSLFLDLSKAFDTLSHNILLKKLNHYGIRGVANIWFENYLSGRQQYVEIDGINSTMKTLTCGVPQGSILGPILFLVYINDINNATTEKILSFADDTTMYLFDNNIASLFNRGNNELCKLFTWFCANKLSLNTQKTKYILFNPSNKQLTHRFRLDLNGNEITQIGKGYTENTLKFLGVFIDEQLNWKPHISHINRKISNAVFSINKLKNFLPRESMETLYYALIHPHISYGILSWGSAKMNVLNKTKKLQKRALRAIHNVPYRTSTNLLFKTSGILTISDLYIQQVLLFMFDFKSAILPNSFNEMFKYNHELHPHRPTRQSYQIHNPKAKTNLSEQLPKHKFPSIWNSWTQKIETNLTRSQFKTHCKIKLLEVY